MNNACPECGAVYAVAEKDIGRRIACKKCHSALVVADEGLVLDEAASSSPRKEETSERERGPNIEYGPGPSFPLPLVPETKGGVSLGCTRR